MGVSEKKEATELVKRCEAVGWQVVRSGADHYKVDTRKGTFTIPSTPSEYRSMRNTLAEAKKYGLEELEAKLAVTVANERKARIDADRAKNDAKLEQIARVNGAVVAQTENVDPTHDVGLGLVNGVAIVAVAPATVKTPVMTKPAPLADAEELLLADGSVTYRCTKNGDDGALCHSLFDSANGVRSHIRFHSPQIKLEGKTVSKTAAASAAKPAAKPNIITATDGRELLIEDVEKTMAMLNSLGVDITKFYDEFGGRILELREVSTQLLERIRAFTAPVVETDPELLRKAAGLDALAAQLKDLMQ